MRLGFVGIVLGTCEMVTNLHTQIENRLITALSVEERNRLLKHLEPIHFARKRILYEAGQSMKNAYFFQSGMASMFAVADDGRTVQIAIVGTDGFVGVPIILMGSKTPSRIVTQTPVEAFRIDAQQLVAQFNRFHHFQEVLLWYSQVLYAQVVQSALCNPLHTIRQRLCRWLLECRDATGSDSFDLTQEDLANMLGSHRNQVSLEARELSKRGFIQYARGSVTIVKPGELENASCECYGAIRQWIDELLSV